MTGKDSILYNHSLQQTSNHTVAAQMSSSGRISKRTFDDKKKALQYSKAEKARKEAAERQNLTIQQKSLEELTEQAKTDPGKQEEVATINQKLQEMKKQLKISEEQRKAAEEEEEKLEKMDIDNDAVEGTSSAPQVANSVNKANLSQGNSGDINTSKENNGDHETNTSNPVKLSSLPGDNEDDEIPMMTIAHYKELIGSPTTTCEVVAWKPETRVRAKEVINRYGPKSHPKYRIEAASESFDEGLPKITAPEHRIGQLKAENGVDWAYNYQNVAGILGVAFRVRDDHDPLRALDPAYHGKNQRYTETQVWIQWKNIKGDNPSPRSWEVRNTAQRVCPMRKKGVADKMIFARAKECEEGFDGWFQEQSKGRDETMSPAPFIKAEKVPDAEKGSPNEPSELTNATSSEEKVSPPGVQSSTSPAPVIPVVGTATSAQASNTPPFDTKGWLTEYESVYGPKEDMSVKERATMMEALKEAKALTK